MRNKMGLVLCLLLAAIMLAGCQTKEPGETQGAVKPTEFPPMETKAPEEPKATEYMGKEFKADTWMKTYGGKYSDMVEDVLLAEDGGYYILCRLNVDFEKGGGELGLIRTDKNGEMLWEKTYPGESMKSGEGLIFTEDGNILIAGITQVDEANGVDIFLMKVDLKGNELETKVIGGPMDEWAKEIQQTEDGGYILFGNKVDPDDFVVDTHKTAGYWGHSHRSSILVIKVDQNLEEVWVSDVDDGRNIYSLGGVQTSDGGYIIVSTLLAYPEMNDNIHLVKIDEDGNEVWTRTWEETRTTVGSYWLTSKGNILIGAMYSESGDPTKGDADYLVMEIDQEGHEIWRKIFGTAGKVDMPHFVLETGDGNILLAGLNTKDLFRPGSLKVVLYKIGKGGEILWEKEVVETYHCQIMGLLEVKGGYLIAITEFGFDDTTDIVMIKTDRDGIVSD